MVGTYTLDKRGTLIPKLFSYRLQRVLSSVSLKSTISRSCVHIHKHDMKKHTYMYSECVPTTEHILNAKHTFSVIVLHPTTNPHRSLVGPDD